MQANLVTALSGVGLLNSTEFGYISGRVTDEFSHGIPDIMVSAPGALPAYTDASGNYLLAVSTGPITVTANPGNSDRNYTSSYLEDVNIVLGEMQPNLNFSLSSGGSLTGFASANGVDPYPGVAFDARTGGLSYGSVVSDSQGRFTISNLPSGTYDVYAYGPNSEQVSPESASVIVTAGESAFVSSFTVSGGFGSIGGALVASGKSIGTGVLIVASTATISGANPPTVHSALRASGVRYYQRSSAADGTFSMDLPAGSYNVYAWYTTFSGSTPNSSKKSATAVMTAAHMTTVNFTW